MHGIDLVLPDFSYVVDRADRLKAIVLTHGHEDHVGALPYLLRETGTDPLVFGTRLTLGLIKSKLDEHGLGAETELVELMPDGSRVAVGPFEVEAVRVTHSIPDAVAVVLHTAHGVIVHTGDFKIDMTPVDGRPGRHRSPALARRRGRGAADVGLDQRREPRHDPVGDDGRAEHARDHREGTRPRDRDVVRVADPPPAAGDRRGRPPTAAGSA